MLPTVVFAADNNDDGFDDEDVAAIQAIINASPTLRTQYNVDDPSTWAEKGLVSWNEETPKRVTTSLSLLYINDSGQYDISDFNGTLDASALTALEVLECWGNPDLTKLILPQAGKLTLLSCYYTGITELDLAANPLLKEIVFPESLAQTVTPDGYRITLTQTPGGMISLYRNDGGDGNPIYSLDVFVDRGYEFVRWNGVANFTDGTTENDAEVKFNITGDMNISADFQLEDRLTLTSLAVEGATLTPEFSGRVWNYTAEVPYDVTKVNIVAEGWSDYEHEITGAGKEQINIVGGTYK